MTNREWLNTLTDEELAERLENFQNCDRFGYDVCDKCLMKEGCECKVLSWLKEEHNDI